MYCPHCNGEQEWIESNGSIPNRPCYGPGGAQHRKHHLQSCQDAHSILLYNILVESNPLSGSNIITVSDVCAPDVRASRGTSFISPHWYDSIERQTQLGGQHCNPQH